MNSCAICRLSTTASHVSAGGRGGGGGSALSLPPPLLFDLLLGLVQTVAPLVRYELHGLFSPYRHSNTLLTAQLRKPKQRS